MELNRDEKELYKSGMETMLWGTFRKARYTGTLTNRRLILSSLFGTKEYMLADVESVERFRIIFLINSGFRFLFKDGGKLELAVSLFGRAGEFERVLDEELGLVR